VVVYLLQLAELTGYKDYTGRVRYRFIPIVW